MSGCIFPSFVNFSIQRLRDSVNWWYSVLPSIDFDSLVLSGTLRYFLVLSDAFLVLLVFWLQYSGYSLASILWYS
jgi:hypothetical protein